MVAIQKMEQKRKRGMVAGAYSPIPLLQIPVIASQQLARNELQ